VENPAEQVLHGSYTYCSYAPISGAERDFAPSVLLHATVPTPIDDEHDWFATPPTVQFVAVEAAPMSGEPDAGVKSVGALTNCGADVIEFASKPVAVRQLANE
jgi:hypothetical protein